MDGHGAGLNEADGVDHAADGHGREFPLARVTDANYVFLDCWNRAPSARTGACTTAGLARCLLEY